MASKSLSLLCEAILEDHFGFYVAKLSRLLLRGALTFRELHKQLHSNFHSNDIRRSLVVLDAHDLIQFEPTVRGVSYSLIPLNVLRFLRWSRVLAILSSRFSAEAAAITEEFFISGRLTVHQCVDAVLEHKTEWKKDDLINVFKELCDAHLLRRCPEIINQEFGVPVFGAPRSGLFTFTMPEPLPENGTSESKVIAGTRKRRGGSSPQKAASQSVKSPPEELWTVDWTQADRLLRHDIIIAIIRQSDDFAEEHERTWQVFLDVCEESGDAGTVATQSRPVAVQEVARALKERYDERPSWEKIDEVLATATRLGDQSNSSMPIIRRLGDSGGGLYVVDYQTAITNLCYQHVESVIRERIDDRAVRIFRLVRMYENVEEEQLPKMAMLASKEAKEICYLMIENGYLSLRPIAKTNDFAPTRTIYFYSQRFGELCYTMLTLSYDSIRNLIRRRLEEVKQHEVLTDKRIKVDTIIRSIKEDEELTEEEKATQSLEVEAMYLAEDDKRTLQRHHQNQRRMHLEEVAIERALFVFALSNEFLRADSLNEAAQRGAKRRRKPAVEF